MAAIQLACEVEKARLWMKRIEYTQLSERASENGAVRRVEGNWRKSNRRGVSSVDSVDVREVKTTQPDFGKAATWRTGPCSLDTTKTSPWI